MNTAQFAKNALLATIVLICAALMFPLNVRAASGNGPTCPPSTSCKVGEFLYDDSYVPITGATCTITSYTPAGATYLNNVSMTGAANGFYSYTFTTSSTTGLYPTQVCCDTGGQHLCLDKSFTVDTSSGGGGLTSQQVSDAVWNGSRSSYTTSGSFGEALQNIVPSSGSIASAVWDYSSRSLSTFGSLVTDIWGSSNRTLTSTTLSDGNTLATKADVNAAQTTSSDVTNALNQNNLLLDQLINKPIIQNFIEDGPTTNLQTKVDNTQQIVNKMTANIQYLSSQSNLVKTNWNILDDNELNSAVSQLSSIVGNSGDPSTYSSLSGQLSWLKNSWSWSSIDTVGNQVKSVRVDLDKLQKSLADRDYQKVKTLISDVKTLASLMGSRADSSKQKTLMASFNSIHDKSVALNGRSIEIKDILDTWGSQDQTKIGSKILQINKEVLAVNQLPQINSVLNSPNGLLEVSTDRKNKNQLLAMGGVIKANQQFLSQKQSGLFSSTWLEEGSIIFKSLVTNPSKIVSQTVPLKYYLPQEVSKDNVIKTDGGLTIEYDTDKNQYYAQGEFTLAPGETKTVSIEVDDNVFKFSDAEIKSWKDQADKLVQPLKSSSFYAQGVTLQSDINASCEKIQNLQASSVTPAERISNYREAKVEANTIKTKLDALKNIDTQASSAGAMFGFVGGAQTLAVWGLMLVIITGFAFMVFYMKLLRPKNNAQPESELHLDEVGAKTTKKKKKTAPEPEVEPKKKARLLRATNIKLAMTVLSFGVIVSSAVIMVRDNNPHQNQVTTQAQTVLAAEISPAPVASSSASLEPQEIVVQVPVSEVVKVYSQPDASSVILTQFSASEQVTKIGESEEWIKVTQDVQKGGKQYTEGWISKEFISTNQIKSDEAKPPVGSHSKSEVSVSVNQTTKKTDSTDITDLTDQTDSIDLSGQYVSIKETPTGWLRVRKTPGGEEISKVDIGSKFGLLDQNSSWYKIQVDKQTSGWVSKQFTSIAQDN